MNIGLRNWRGGDFELLRRLNAESAHREPESAVFRRHGRYLDGVSGGEGEHVVIESRGEALGIAEYRYVPWRGSVAWGVGVQFFAGARTAERSEAVLRDIVALLAATPVPRRIVAMLPRDPENDAAARAAGFELVDGDWAFALDD